MTPAHFSYEDTPEGLSILLFNTEPDSLKTLAAVKTALDGLPEKTFLDSTDYWNDFVRYFVRKAGLYADKQRLIVNAEMRLAAYTPMQLLGRRERATLIVAGFPLIMESGPDGYNPDLYFCFDSNSLESDCKYPLRIARPPQ